MQLMWYSPRDLINARRDTYLCVGAHKRVPRRYRGRDIMDGWEESGMTTEPVQDRPVGDHAPLLSGVNGGTDVAPLTVDIEEAEI